MRDDFDPKTKEILFKRAGAKCSNPNCGQETSGPHTDGKRAINIGVAAHITAASVGGPRYDSAFSQEERTSPENGIWLCQVCAKLIDSDEKRYTVDVIRRWKRDAENEALARIEGRHRRIEGNSRAPHLLEDDAVTALAQEKLLSLPLECLPKVATLPPGSYMPIGYNRDFVGREESLKALAAALKGSDEAVLGQVETVVVSGMGGIGKSQLASEFVHRYGQFFVGGVYWLSFTNADTVGSEIVNCGTLLGLERHPNYDGLSLDDKARLVLSAWETSLPRLLVFDNCEDEELLTKWMPRTGSCRIIITSLRSNWPSELGIKVLSLDLLKRDESISLLDKHREDISVDYHATNDIAEELGDLPLALYLANKFLCRYRYANIGSPVVYLTQLREKKRLQHASLQAQGLTPATKHIQNIEATFALSFEQLKIADPNDLLAIKLLMRTVFFAPSLPIPRDIVRRTIQPNGYDADVELLAEKALERLLSLGLLQSAEDGALRLHQLIADFVKMQEGKFDADAQFDVEKLMFMLASALTRVGYHEQILTLLPHLRTVTSLAQSRIDVSAANLCSALAYFLLHAHAYNESQFYCEKALAIHEAIPGPNPENIVNALNNLAECFDDRAG